MVRDNFLIVTWDGGGNVPPALALAARLSGRGHRVRVSGPASLRSAVITVGAELAPYRTVEALPSDLRHEENWPRVDAILNGQAMIDDLLAEHEADPIGVLVVDSLSGAGLAVGERIGVPMAILVHTLYQPYASWGPLVANVRETREAVGLAPVEADRFVDDVLGQADAVLALVPPGFDFPVPNLPANTRYVGPILQPTSRSGEGATGIGRSASPDDPRPTVLISFGSTIQNQREALAPVLTAFAELPFRGLLTLGGVLDPDTIAVPRNVEARGHVPHASVLPDVAAVVCHGGLSTITASLAAGKPLVVIPQGRDQGDNATRVAASGAGLALPLDADPGQIADAIRIVVEDARFVEAARRWADKIAALGAGALATDIVEGLASSRATVAGAAVATG
jgi:MGT family glycosyltransferase